MDPHLMSLEAGTFFEPGIYSICNLPVNEADPGDHSAEPVSENSIISWPICLN
jgi:hypothetical protein